MRNVGLAWIASCMCIAAALMAGCGVDAKAKSDLVAGYSALDARQYDEAIGRADAYLQRQPDGPGVAEALYLRGRALEQKGAASPQDAAANLQAARNSYIDALKRNPPPKLEAYLHTSLANVAYFQDDYFTAANEWTIAYDKLDDVNAKSWTLYRIGLCRQRMGQFADADAVFTVVGQRYPNTIPAQRSNEKRGARAFTVQLATFASGVSADAAVASLRREGVAAMKQADSQGRSVVMAGPVSSYQQALSLRSRYAAKYPDAVIVP